jgi:hypothetical protein
MTLSVDFRKLLAGEVTGPAVQGPGLLWMGKEKRRSAEVRRKGGKGGTGKGCQVPFQDNYDPFLK